MSDLPIRRQPNNLTTPSAFRSSYMELLEWIRSRVLAENNLNHMLAIAQFLGEVRWSNFGGVYQDDELEVAIEQRVLQSKEFHVPDFPQDRAGTVLIASTLSDIGGHSRVVLNWMKAFREAGDHRLLITRSVTSAFKISLTSENIPYRLCAGQGVELVNEIIANCANAERIVLHIHPDDIATAIAGRLMARYGKQVLFYNHADHVFSYGISSARQVCEVSVYGIELSERTKRTRESCYIGIPIGFDTDNDSRENEARDQSGKTVLTCGAPYKYAPGGAFFGEFIDDLLKRRSDVTVLLVGSTGNEPWWSKHRERWGIRVCFLGDVSHSKYLEVMRMADVYVDSFPITGGTAFPEALLNGKLVAGLDNPIQGYSPVDELRVSNLPALTEQVLNLLNREPESIHRVQEAREKAKAIHSLTSFHERVKNIYTGSCEKNAETNVDVDTYWLERLWDNGKRVRLSDSDIWFNVPLHFCISFQLTFNRLLEASEKIYRGYIMRRIALKLLPDQVREYVIKIHDRSRKPDN